MSKTDLKQKNQIDRFKEAARQLEATESGAAFYEKLKEIVKQMQDFENPKKKPWRCSRF